MNEAVLALENVEHGFTQAGTRLNVLNGCSFKIGPGELVGLIGPSGSGKSTLLHIAGLLERPEKGSVLIRGRNSVSLNDNERTALRREDIGFVYQFHHLLPEFSALENIIVPQMIAGVSYQEASERGRELLELVELSQRATHRPAQLSGGEQQRVALARALANRPKLLIADEPTGNLDPVTSDHVFKVLNNLVRSQNLALLMATHNLDLAKRVGRIFEIKAGIVEEKTSH